MLMFALVVGFTLLVAYIIYVLLLSSDGEHGSNLLDAFVVVSASQENSGCSSSYDNAQNGGVQESEDNDLDLSEADFAPAHCGVVLKPCI